MRPARAAYARLSEAMTDTPPNCEGWADLFTSDDRADVETLDFAAALCRTCPLVIECGAYARAARPAFGIWAGVEHSSTGPGRPKKAGESK
jgi:hypothetical protein